MRLGMRAGPVSVSGNLPLIDAGIGIGVLGVYAALALGALVILWTSIWLAPLALIAWFGLKWLVYVEGRPRAGERFVLYSLFGLVIVLVGLLYKLAIGAWGRWSLLQSGDECGSVQRFSLALPESSSAYVGDPCRPTGTFLFVDAIPYVALTLALCAFFGLAVFRYEDDSPYDSELKKSASLTQLWSAVGLRFLTSYSTLLLAGVLIIGWMTARQFWLMGVDDWRTIEFVGLDGAPDLRKVAIYRGVRHARSEFLMNFFGGLGLVIGIASVTCIIGFRWSAMTAAAQRSLNICKR